MKKKCLFFALIFCVLFIFFAVPIYNVYCLPTSLSMFAPDLDKLKENNYFSSFVSAELAETNIVADVSNKKPETFLDFKLFNLIPIKRQKINILKEDEVFVGGVPIGLSLKADGALVVGSSSIKTIDGEYDIANFGTLLVGDLIKKIDDVKVNSTSDISNYLNNKKDKQKEVSITFLRDGKENTLEIIPVQDLESKKYRLGVWVRDDASGIGTLTYVKKDNRFGALGHPLCDADAKSVVSVKSGKVYNCSVLGVNKGRAGSPGELRGMFLHGGNEQGYIDKNNKYGIFGELKEDCQLLSKLDKLEIGGRFDVKPGNAKIKCCVDGNIKFYDIEIIKTNNKNYSDDKSMIIRVNDEELLSKTGGIVQGMSGSPIIQNNKIVGAITHVFVNDPTKGYGVYLDFMLKE